jgi:hypothetical protein
MEDHIVMVFSGVMDENMSILQEEEVVADIASSSTWRPKHHRRYVNHDHEAAHFRLRHDYFDDDCVDPPPPALSYFCRRYRMRMTLFSKQYA